MRKIIVGAVTLRIPMPPSGGLGADLLGVCEAPRMEGSVSS
jgi:hypothetical protein